LLPPEWFELLNSTRSLNYLVNGNKTRFHKFCSMVMASVSRLKLCYSQQFAMLPEPVNLEKIS